MKTKKPSRQHKAETAIIRKILTDKRVAIPAVAVLALALIGGGILAGRAALRPNTVALYDLDENSIQAVRSLAAEVGAETGRKWQVVELSGDSTLDASLKGPGRPDLVIARDGAALSSIAKAFAPIDQSLLRRMPSAQRHAGALGDARYGIALQADHFEMAYRADLQEVGTLAELVASAKKLAKDQRWPLECAGADDECLLSLVSALAESQGGYPGWSAIERELASGKSFADTALRPAADMLIEWQREKLIHSEWIRHSEKDVTAFMKGGLTDYVFMPLSGHRRVPFKVIKGFNSQRFPAAEKNRERALIGETTIAAIPASSRRKPEAMAFIDRALSPQGQKALTWASGLSPVNSSIQTKDLQATDARFWIASSRQSLPQLGRAAYPLASGRSQMAKAIRDYIITTNSR